ncbi:MAG: hypothetical protein AAGA23_19560 [Pseudomonadota bacterium]
MSGRAAGFWFALGCVTILLAGGLSEFGVWAWVSVTRPPNLHLYPANQVWLGGFSHQLTGIFYAPRPHHERRFCRDEFCTRVTTNSSGFRSDRETAAHPDVAIVGDSFAFGWAVEVEERYGSQLDKLLVDQRVESLAYPNGHSPPFYDFFLKQNPQYLPNQLLIVQLFAWNDLAADQKDLIYWYDERNRWVGLGSRSLMVNADGYFDAPDQPFLPSFEGLAGVVGKSWAGRLVLESLRPKTSPPERPSVLAPLDRGEFDFSARRALRHIEDLAGRARDHGSDVVVLYVPFATLVGNYPLLCQYEARLCATRAEMPDPLATALALWGDEVSIPVLDPTKALRDAERSGQRTYFDHDGHWTPLGHRVAAGVLNRWITEQKQ